MNKTTAVFVIALTMYFIGFSFGKEEPRGKSKDLASVVSTKISPIFCGYKTSFLSNQQSVCEFHTKIITIDSSIVITKVIEIENPFEVIIKLKKPKQCSYKVGDFVTVIGKEWSGGYENGIYYSFK